MLKIFPHMFLTLVMTLSFQAFAADEHSHDEDCEHKKNPVIETMVDLYGKKNYPQDFVGKFMTQGNCSKYYKDFTITMNDAGILTIGSGQSQSQAIFEKINTKLSGKKYDCTPSGQVGEVQCQAPQTKDSISLRSRGCMIMCGPWHNHVTLTAIDGRHVELQTVNFKKGECILSKVVAK